MKSIYKYPLQVTGRQVVELPDEAQILSVKDVAGELVLYALVNNDTLPQKLAGLWCMSWERANRWKTIGWTNYITMILS